MIHIHHNYSLKKLNSFGLNVSANEFTSPEDPEQILELLSQRKLKNEEFLILGEGSNILFRNNYEGLIIHPNIKGIEIIDEDDINCLVKVASGENWDNFVSWCVDHKLSGVENLSLIPGSAGSAPVQNIGAYGVEVSERVEFVEGIMLASGEKKKLYKKDCNFGYRQSVFKNELLNRFVITHIILKLDKKHRFTLSYGGVSQEFNKKKNRDLRNLRKTIIKIRESKLPDYTKTGNAGSFFKNPVINVEFFGELRDKYPEIPSFPIGDQIKIPAAWLIEKAGWKGVREKNIGTWPQQPLVIVNYGDASGESIFSFSEKIREAVHKQFNIDLDREVKVI